MLATTSLTKIQINTIKFDDSQPSRINAHFVNQSTTTRKTSKEQLDDELPCDTLSLPLGDFQRLQLLLS